MRTAEVNRAEFSSLLSETMQVMRVGDDTSEEGTKGRDRLVSTLEKIVNDTRSETLSGSYFQLTIQAIII